MNTIFDYAKWERLVVSEAKNYNERDPFPYAYFDGLFDDGLLEQANLELNQSNFALDERAISDIEIKTRSDFDDNEDIPHNLKKIFNILNGGKFLTTLSRLTTIEGLISDPYYDGGGVNIIRDGGTLAVHVDGTHQHRMNLCRRLNVILFLNDKWDVGWNGFHEQWVYLDKHLPPSDENQRWKCVRKILPKINRLYVFTTNDYSWHGHAGKLSLPPAMERRSLITYYYTVHRPDTDLVFDSPHRAIFIPNKQTLSNPDAFKDTEVIL